MDFRAIEFNPYKFIHHHDQLFRLASGGDIFPVTVELDLVAYCNHQCSWCVDPCHLLHTRLKTSFVFMLLDELKQIGVQGIVFKGGGEPGLHPRFSEILEYAHGKGFEIGIVTNGSCIHLFSEKIIACADYIRVSVDGPTPESHRKIHGSNDFETIVQGVKQLTDGKKHLGKRHPVIGLSFAMDYTMADLTDSAAILGQELEVDYILFRSPFFEEVGRNNTMTPEQKIKLIGAFEMTRNTFHNVIDIMIDYWISDSEMDRIEFKPGISPRRGGLHDRFNGIEHETGRCLAAPLMAVVTGDQQVYPCCNLRHLNPWSIGRIEYEQGISFQSIWESTRRGSIMKKIRRAACIGHCTHPLSKYNEIIEYLRSPGFHRGFV